MTYSIIPKSQLEGALRLDAEYYQPEFLDLISNLKNQNSRILGNLVKEIKHPAEIKRAYQKSGIPFLLTKNISSEFYVLQFEEKRFISFADAQRIFQNELMSGDVVMTRTGANYGDVNVYLGKPKGLLASAHVLVIRPKGIAGEYLATFLNSKIGRVLVKRGIYGTAQPEISPEYLKSLLILVPSEAIVKNVASLVQLAQNRLEKSKLFYSQAESLLLEELGLKDFEPKDEIFNIVNLSDVKPANRMDAEYFQPKYNEVISRIKHKVLELGELVEIKKGIAVGSEQYQEQGNPFLRVSNMSRQGIVDNDQKYVSDELYQKLKDGFEPKIGEILLTKDASPGIAFVLKKQTKGIIAGGILRLQLKKKIEPEYLTLTLNSLIGQMQMERDTGGSVIIHWRPEQIKNCLIPILPKNTQQKIAGLVQKSHQAREKAKQLLEQAKQRVETLIENG